MSVRLRHLLIVATAVLAVVALPSAAWAHGEQTQESFLRASTVLLYDVEVSDTELEVNDTFTVTGRLRIMEAWPDHTVEHPEIGFLSLVTPGPVVTIEDRRLNGEFTPQSVNIDTGQTYEFSVTAKARVPGRWHIHPSFAVEGVGTLAGSGEWIEVEQGDAAWSSTVDLPRGGTIELATYGLGQVSAWHLLSLGIGLGWLVYWLRRPLLARAGAVDAGEGGRLTGPRNRRVGLAVAGLVLAVIAAGNVWASQATTGPLLPLQVARITPEPLPEPERFVTAELSRAAWRSDAQELEVTVQATNTGERDVSLSRLQIAEFEAQDHTTVEPSAPIAPGGTAELTLRIDGEFLREHNLLPLGDPQLRFTGLLFFTDTAGAEQVSEVDEVTAPVLPL